MQPKARNSKLKKLKQSGANPTGLDTDGVNSIIEHTNNPLIPQLPCPEGIPLPPSFEVPGKVKGKGVEEYRDGVAKKGVLLYNLAVLDNNLLSAKLSLWAALQMVEKRMRENRQ